MNELLSLVQELNIYPAVGLDRMPPETSLISRNLQEDEIVLSVLDVVERDPSVTQRSVASELGIALGLANAYLKRCIGKGLIKVSQVPRRRYAYYLTTQGFAEKSRLTAAYLAHSFSFFRRAMNELGTIFIDVLGRGQKRLVFIGHGELADIAGIVAREYSVEILGVIGSSRDPKKIKDEVTKLGHVDAVIVTSLSEPQEVYSAALSAIGPEKVYAPALLRITRTQGLNAGEAGS